MSKTKMRMRNGRAPAHSGVGPKGSLLVSTLGAVLAGLVLLAGTVGVWLYLDLSSQMSKAGLDTSHLTSPDGALLQPPADSFDGRPVNILFMGIDSRADQDEELLPIDNEDPTMRSDTTLLMHFSADRTQISIVSIPRDMWILLPECVRSDGSVSPEQYGQFNWAFSYGALEDDIAAGVTCTERTVKGLTDAQIDGFAVVDFNGFASMIDSLGGVEMCLDEPIKDTRYLNLDLPAGCQVLDAVTATEYARVRYAGDGSDMGRIQRQQDLLGAMVNEALDSNLLTEMPKLYAFLAATMDSTRLSPSLTSLKVDAGLANSVKNIGTENIRFLTMPVVTADFDHNRLLPKEPQNTEFWDAVLNDTDLPAGTVFKDIDGNYFTVEEDGEITEGGDPRTDNEIGSMHDPSL